MNIKNKITINEHSSIRIIESDKVFYFDPFNIEKKINDANYIFITHEHYDHFDVKSILNVMNEKTIFIYPKTMETKFNNDLEVNMSNVIKVEPNEEIELGEGIQCKIVSAYNLNKKFHEKIKKWVGFVLYVNGTSYYVTGDTDLIDEIKQIDCDVLLIPIGGTYTMDVNEAVELVNIINPKVVIPTHYGSVVGDKKLGKKFLSLVDNNIEAIELIH